MTTLETGRTMTKKRGTRTKAKKRATRYVFWFGDGTADGDRTMKNLLGGKGANLAEMSNLGLPVPPGFTISTEVCTGYYERGRRYPDGVEAQVEANLAKVEASLDRRFGDADNPLLVSVRSGARVSMPEIPGTPWRSM